MIKFDMDNLYFSSYLEKGYQFQDITVVGADRQPCPVCGHPTGDCKGEQAPSHIIGFDAKGGATSSPMHFVEEDIWAERQITPYTKARVLLYKKGDKISHDEAVKLGLL